MNESTSRAIEAFAKKNPWFNDDNPKRPLRILAERGYLPDPHPEEVSLLDGVRTGFTIGLRMIESDHAARKIVPTALVVFEIDDYWVDLPSSIVRNLISRLQEMCDAADKINQKLGN
jgi:hypothetical protein